MADFFTIEELKLLNVDQLQKLCDYFKIEYTARTKKSKLIDLVSDQITVQFQPTLLSHTGHPYDGGNMHVSARVQRIRDLNLGGRK